MSVAAKVSHQNKVSVKNEWCKGCAICAELCPHAVFIMDSKGKARVGSEERCTGCFFCVTHCPDFAIEVRRVNYD